MKKPFLSVLIVAFKRKEFIKIAINSVLAQKIPREFYEIIVIKNFEDKILDAFIKEHEIINVLTDSDGIGAKFSLGIIKSSGEVVIFLEDDDFFHRDKLAVVYELFKKHEKLGYYHNGYIPIDEDDLPIEIKLYENPKEMTYIHNNGTDESSLLNVLRHSFDYNSSSVSIRKSLILPYTNLLVRIKTTPDNFFYYFALASSCMSIFDQRQLTYYRVHNSASNPGGNEEEFYRSTKKLITSGIADLELINNTIEDKIVKHSVYCNLNSWKLRYLLVDKDVPRNEVSIRTGTCFSCFLFFKSVNFLRLTIFGFFLYLFPAFTRIIYYKNKTKFARK